MKYKNILATGLAVCIMCGALVGCGGDDKKAEETQTNAQQETVVNDATEKSTDYIVSDRNSEVYAGLTISDENKHLADILDYARSVEDRTNYMPIISAEQEGAEDAFRILGFEESDVEEYAVALAAMTNRAYGVAIVKPTEASAEKVDTGFANLKTDTEALFTGTLDDQAQIATEAICEQVGDYKVFVMCPDASYVFDEIKAAIEDPSIVNDFVASLNNSTTETTDATEATDEIGTIEEGTDEIGTIEIGGIEEGTTETTEGTVSDINTNEGSTVDTMGTTGTLTGPNTSDDWQ